MRSGTEARAHVRCSSQRGHQKPPAHAPFAAVLTSSPPSPLKTLSIPCRAAAAVDDLIATKRLPQGTRKWLMSYAYRFEDGPWLKAWVERGVDPRERPEMRRYQTVTFRTAPSWCVVSCVVRVVCPSQLLRPLLMRGAASGMVCAGLGGCLASAALLAAASYERRGREGPARALASARAGWAISLQLPALHRGRGMERDCLAGGE